MELWKYKSLKDTIMKKIIIASVLVVGLAAGFAYAHNNGYGMGGNGGHMMGGSQGMMGSGMMGPGMMNGYRGKGGSGGYGDCPGAAWFGQDGWNSESHQKFLEDTVGLRKEMNNKQFEYMEARRNSNTTPEQFSALEKEVIDIRTKLQEKAEQYR
jgi:hypothetical protein